LECDTGAPARGNGRRAATGATRGRAGSQRHGSEREYLLDRLVELADTREPGRERDLGCSQLGRLEQDSRRLGTLRPCEREWTCTHLGDEHSVEMALAVAETTGESRHAVTVDDAIGNEAHRSADRVGTPVPFR